MHSRRTLGGLVALVVTVGWLSPSATADDRTPDQLAESDLVEQELDDPSTELADLDAGRAGATETTGNQATPQRRLDLVSRGQRLEEQATTDVWTHDKYAYTGTFNSPCGGEDGAGIWVWDVGNVHKPENVGIIPSPEGSRSNDVKVDSLGVGDILVHSNEACAGGPGGVEVYNVDDPTSPEHLAHIQIDDVNPLLRDEFGYVDFGVHNLFLWSLDGRDYIGVKANSLCGNFQIFDITDDPTNPEMVGFWGAEQIRLAELGLGDLTCADLGEDELDTLLEVEDYLLTGFGASDHKQLHDITITDDGTHAYLSNWDAGLILLDISDPTDPRLVSQAIDQEQGSLDGEVNSHSAWPSEDGRIVVEGEEDFSAWVSVQPPGSLTFGDDPENPAPLPGTALSTSAGDTFEANQTGNDVTLEGDSVTVDAGPLAGESFPAVELLGDQPKFADVGPLTGEAVWIGRACDGDEILNEDAVDSGDIAVVRRGECAFRDKNFNAAATGAAAVIIANNVTDDTPWGGIRIWDYSDPANPTLASTFDTTCSAAPEPLPECDPFGTYSVHNVVVESQGHKVLAYISWYWDGMLVLDVTDPYNPEEVARFFDNSPEFIESNGGRPHDFWGVYKEPGRPWIYGSDRNGGLDIFKLRGGR